MKKNKITNKILINYNCINKKKSAFVISSRLWKEIAVSVSCNEFSKNNRDYLSNLYLVNKLSKNLMRGGKNYKIINYIHSTFSNLKLIGRINPLMLYFYIIFFFLILITFQKVRRGRQFYKIPRNILELDIFLLHTVKLFSNMMKVKSSWETDLQSNLFNEFFAILLFVKRSKFYNTGLKNYYFDTEEGIKHISSRFRW